MGRWNDDYLPSGVCTWTRDRSDSLLCGYPLLYCMFVSVGHTVIPTCANVYTVNCYEQQYF